MWTNSKTVAHNYGAGLGITYRFHKKLYFKGNTSYAKMRRKSNNDGLEDGFNTPEWILNFTLGSENLFAKTGFTITYRWQSEYDWQSFLVSGEVPSYSTWDAQVTTRFKKVSIKVGGSNILNQYYCSFLGGPAVGGFYYTTLTYGL